MHTEPLWYWMAERHAIYNRRTVGQPWPWTEDPILRDYSFTNVFREQDRVTVWIRENIREPFADHEHLWFMLAIARFINWPDTLAELIAEGAWPDREGFKPAEMTRVLQAREARREKVYTGAYKIPADNLNGGSKHPFIAEVVLGKVWEARPPVESCETLAEAQVLLTRFRGWGPFMTYEVVTDLRWTRYLCDATDTLTWANAGPGALLGLQRLRDPEGRLSGRKVGQREACGMMRQLLEEAPSRLPVGFPALEMRDIEHSCCELQKYLRTRLGEDTPKAKYRSASCRAGLFSFSPAPFPANHTAYFRCRIPYLAPDPAVAERSALRPGLATARGSRAEHGLVDRLPSFHIPS